MKDQLGIIFSSLCIVHCIAMPIILALGISGLFTTEIVHYILIVPVVLLILLTLPTAYKRGGVLSPILAGGLGMMLLIAGLFLGEDNETLLTIMGGSLVVVFHLWNLQTKHKHKSNITIVSRLLIKPTAECLLIKPQYEQGIDIKSLNKSSENSEVIYAKK
tara:strand:+ start:14818 stop:15300 length:483 start_codon:yes stop_codon:yes gene_type:complete